MVATPGIRNLIREGKVHQVYSAMQAGGRYGMQTMDMSLAAHVKAGRITQQMAFERCHDPEELQRLIGSRGDLRVLGRQLVRRRHRVGVGSGSFGSSMDVYGSSNTANGSSNSM